MVRDAALQAERSAARLAARRAGTRRLEASAAPLIFGSPEGRRLRATQSPGALALGAPRRDCPARAFGSGDTLRSAAESALRACFAQLENAGATNCGCELTVAGDAVLAPRDALSYAAGVSARLVSRDLRLDLTFSARESALPDGGRRLDLVAPAAAPIRLDVAPDGTAALDLDGRWTARREAEGLSRGRFRERFSLTRGSDGARATLAVGWEPVEYARLFRRLERPGP